MARSNRAVKTCPMLSGPVVISCSRRAVMIVLCGSGIQVSCGAMGATGMNARPAVRCPQQLKLGSSAYRISRPQVTQPSSMLEQYDLNNLSEDDQTNISQKLTELGFSASKSKVSFTV